MRSSNRNESRSSRCYCSESIRRQSTQLAQLVMAEGATTVVDMAEVAMAAVVALALLDTDGNLGLGCT